MLPAIDNSLNALPILNKIPGCHLFLLPDAPRFTILSATDAYLAATYLKREEATGRGVFEALTDNPNYAEATGVKNLTASLLQVMEHKVVHRMADQRYDIYNPIAKQYEQRIWRPVNNPVFDDSGNLQYIIHTVEDITATVLLQEQNLRTGEKLKNSESLFHNMVEQSPVAILLSRGDDVVIETLNAPMLQCMKKSSFEEVVGRKMLEVLPELEGQQALQLVINVQRTGIPFRGDDVPVDLLVNGELEQHYFNFSYTPVIESGEITGVLHIAMDVTEQVTAKQQLKENEVLLQKRVLERTLELENLNAELQRSNKNLEEFAYAASHDMKEPIRKIHFFADRLKKRLEHKMEEEDRRYFDRLEAGTKRMVTLIDDLLVYSHVTRGVSAVEMVDLNQMLSFVLDDLELHIEELGATIEVGPLPTIKGRPRQLQQLFENLIGNALKYSKQGVAPVVHVSSRLIKGSDRGVHSITTNKDKLYHLVEVSDNGIGFEQSDAERIFNVFTRLHGNSEYRGTGVGLSIVQKVVENHHGSIWAESTPGEGATFRILLPVE